MSTTAVLAVVVLVVLVVTAAVVRRRARGAPAAPLGRAVAVGTGLAARLSKTRGALAQRLESVFRRGAVDDATWQELVDALVGADVGVAVAAAIVERVRAARPADPTEVRRRLADELEGVLRDANRDLHLDRRPAVVLVVGVNGSGKTTTIAKLARRLREEGRTVVLGAADTWRAAAVDQLRAWGERLGIEVVAGAAGADPASVAYDAFDTARRVGADVVVVDTAGRLHARTDLMDELGKVARVLRREAGDVDEVLLVVDGTTGQNGLEQARRFTEAVGVTGLVLTKLDGTARGGIAVAVERELGIPVKLIGVGEAMDDLVPFDPHDFVAALLEP